MTKRELIKKFAEANSITLKEASIIVNTFFDTIKEALKNNQRVEIRGFGVFKVKFYKEYMGRNPKTGKAIMVPSKRLPFFKPGKDLKQRLNKDD